MTPDIKTKGNYVFLADKLIYTADSKILAHLNIDALIILVIDLQKTDNSNQNTFCIDLNGTLIWTIEKSDYHQRDCPANNIYSDNGKHFIYRWCGIEEEIDIRTGKILSSLLIK